MSGTDEELRMLAVSDGPLAALTKLRDRRGLAAGPRERALDGRGAMIWPAESRSADRAFVQSLMWIRIGVIDALLSGVVEHLRARDAGESTVLLQQLVRAQLADIVVDRAEVMAALETEPDLSAIDATVTMIGRRLLSLLGGSGFVSSPLVDAVESAELLTAVYGYGEGE